jgi:hypothetical protein
VIPSDRFPDKNFVFISHLPERVTSPVTLVALVILGEEHFTVPYLCRLLASSKIV